MRNSTKEDECVPLVRSPNETIEDETSDCENPNARGSKNASHATVKSILLARIGSSTVICVLVLLFGYLSFPSDTTAQGKEPDQHWFNASSSSSADSSPNISAVSPVSDNNMTSLESGDELEMETPEPETTTTTTTTLAPEKIYRLDNSSTTFREATLEIAKNMERHGVPSPGKLCDEIRDMERSGSDPIVLLNKTELSCSKGWGGGVGNQLHTLIDLRFTAFAEGRTAFLDDCGEDALAVGRDLPRPWMSGFHPAGASRKPPFGMIMPEDFCPWPNDYYQGDGDDDPHGRKLRLPLKFMLPLVGHDLRRMAVALVGVPGPSHPSASFEQDYLLLEAQHPPYTPTEATGKIYRIPIHDYYENGPKFKEAQMDDVVIHMRCGDVLLGAHGEFKYPKFNEYAKIISPEARTIGIVTQPFSADGDDVQFRKNDKLDVSGERCKAIVYGLVDFLGKRFPKAKFSIHNGPHETLALAFARMVMANQSLALIPSTFSVFPTLTGFGTGYFPTLAGRETKVQYGWLHNKMTEGLYAKQGFEEVEITSPRLRAEDLAQMWDEKGGDAVVAWLRNENAK